MSEKRFNPSDFDNKQEVWDLLEKQAIIIEDLENENEQLRQEVENLQDIAQRTETFTLDKNKFVKLLICIALSNRGWVEEEVWFMKQLEKKYFLEDD